MIDTCQIYQKKNSKKGHLEIENVKNCGYFLHRVQQSHFKETVYFESMTSDKVLDLIWLNLQAQKTELTLESPWGFKPKTPRFGISTLNINKNQNKILPKDFKQLVLDLYFIL